MRPSPAAAAATLVVLAVPLVLLGNAIWILLNPWLVDLEYALPGFPAPAAEGPALTGSEREELADTGIESVRPFGDGAGVLRAAELPQGGPAFDLREIAHMQDVRDLVGRLLIAWALALAALVAACAWLVRRAGGGVVRRALARGAALTAGAMALIGLVMLVDFELFFDGFHGIFFEGDSWRFNETYTLRSLYPDEFWGVAGGLAALLVLAQGAVLALWAGRGPAGALGLMRGPWVPGPAEGE